MTVTLIWAAMVIVLVGVGARLAWVWLRFRGRRAITCPENRRPAGVLVNARHAAASGLTGAPDLRLATCTRWPEKAGCGQPCLSEIAASPEDCLVRNILTRWYAGKACACCGRHFGEIEWNVQKPTLLGKDRISLEWDAVPSDQLNEVLAASQPLCFACHMANTLVREHPELVVNRSKVDQFSSLRSVSRETSVPALSDPGRNARIQ